MKQILTIAWREVARLRQRFSGGVSPLAVLVLLAGLGLLSFALRETVTLGYGLYRVGVAGDAAEIRDGRFAVMPVDAATGAMLLEQRVLDVIVDGGRVLARDDDKSQYAVGALKRYLARQQVIELGATQEITRAFPLRVQLHYFDAPDETPQEPFIPSLQTPPTPFSQVIIAFLYIMPLSFISIFFTSSFMDEKIKRRLTLLLSAPITPFQIIMGKMLPYLVFATAATAAIALLTRAPVGLALAIYAPTALFIFAIYLMVPLFYRTFQDTTFIAMFVTTTTAVYLVFPAMFTDLSELAYMSPLTLAVKMYRGEAFGWQEYLFPSVPMVLIFGVTLYVGSRLLHEEFLMTYYALTRKMAEALYWIMERKRPALSIFMLSLGVVPAVYLAQLIILAVATNLPLRLMLGAALVTSAAVEELVKTMGIAVLIERGEVRSLRRVLLLAFLSALGFLVGEKLLTFVSVSIVSQTFLSAALFNTGFLLAPLAAHFCFTAIVVVVYARFRPRYVFALALGIILHTAYNAVIVGGSL
ncbi:MAG: ABC transporter permease [Chloroflexi bacterium]|nr:ABC transporter permease [Chloroflexota bacterium]